MPAKRGNLLLQGEALASMAAAGGVRFDLIYLDPPFLTGRVLAKQGVASFDDRWSGGIGAYIGWLSPRLAAARELLSSGGNLVLHLDWHAVHYAKVELDRLFGEKKFRNEIVWCYKSGGAGARNFARKHDTLLWYSAGADYYFAPQKEKSYNRELRRYGFANVPEFQDEVGWHTIVTMKDWWTIDMVGRTSAERTGYPTQKPVALLSRLVESLAPPKGRVGDFFCGSGTTGVAANALDRRWVLADQSPDALRIASERLGVRVTEVSAP